MGRAQREKYGEAADEQIVDDDDEPKITKQTRQPVYDVRIVNDEKGALRTERKHVVGTPATANVEQHK